MLPMPELTEKQLLALLRDRRCPVGHEFRSGQKTRLIALPDLLAFIEQEVGHREGLEGEVDALMTGLARERLSLVDPWSAPRRGLRRMLGKRNPRKVAYEAPAELFHDAV